MKFCLGSAVARHLGALILAGSYAMRVFAQTPPPKPEPALPPSQPLNVQPSTLSQTMPDHLAGVDAGRVVRWTLKDSILAALEKNPDIEIGRQNVRLAQFSILAAQGVYDPLASSTLNYNSQKTPNLSQFSGSSQNFLQNNALTYNFGYLQPVERTGGSYQINFNNSRNTSNTASLANYYNPALTVTLTQPLKRNLAIDTNRHLIQINKKKLDLSDAQFRQQVIQIIVTVQDVKFFRNQTKPQIDLTASYGLVGVGGSVASFPDANGVLQPANVAPVFIGGYGTALGNLFNNSFPTWRVGVNISLPLRNHTALANLGSALETGRQLDTQLRKQLQTIEADVRAAYHAVEAARLRYGAARSAREYAEQQLTGEQEKFSVGLSTTFLALTRQNDLSQARGAEVQALTDYNKAVAALQSAISTTLSENSIEIQSGKDDPVGASKQR